MPRKSLLHIPPPKQNPTCLGEFSIDEHITALYGDDVAYVIFKRSLLILDTLDTVGRRVFVRKGEKYGLKDRKDVETYLRRSCIRLVGQTPTIPDLEIIGTVVAQLSYFTAEDY